MNERGENTGNLRKEERRKETGEVQHEDLNLGINAIRWTRKKGGVTKIKVLC